MTSSPGDLADALAGLPYPVRIGRSLEGEFGAFVAGRSESSVVIVCDRRVEDHANRFARKLPGRRPALSFDLGERRKRLGTVEKVLDALAAVGADRDTLLIGVGGGVAGDLFGFVAATYMRGIAFVNIATSVVAMVDAAIGGKTGVDLRAGKNLAGVFRNPVAVFAAIDTLATLGPRHIREGVGEIVKHAILAGESDLSDLENIAGRPYAQWPWEALITRSMNIKAEVVLSDHFEAGRRELLNLGHTFAHGIEYASDYRISHGAAVAIGLRGAGLLAQKYTGFSAPEHARILNILAACGLPACDERVAVDDILAGMLADKKARAGKLRFVLPRAIGDVAFRVEARRSDVRAVVAKLCVVPSRRELAG